MASPKFMAGFEKTAASGFSGTSMKDYARYLKKITAANKGKAKKTGVHSRRAFQEKLLKVEAIKKSKGAK